MAGSSSSTICGVGVLLLFAILFVVAVTEADDTIIDQLLPICKTVGGGSYYFDVQFCLAALGSDNRSRNAERYRDFSAIVIDLVTANATSTEAKINGLIRAGERGNKDVAMTRGLRSCQALYGAILKRQPGCAAAVKNGKFSDAVASLEKSAAAVKECEAGFGKNKVASPVAAENDNAFKLTKLAVGLLRFAY